MSNPDQDSAVLEAVLEAAVDAVVVSDQFGIIQRANAAAGMLFGYDVVEMIGQNLGILMPKALADLHDTFMAHHITTGEKRIIGIGRDVEGQRKNGTIFPLHLSVGSTEISGTRMYVGIMHDLTNRKATEEALARSQRLDAIGKMTGGIAHDFNNLLTVVIGNLELLQMRNSDPVLLSMINDALESAELGSELTSQLLVFARRGNLKPVQADLRLLCAEILRLLNRTLGANYRITTRFAESIEPVMVDPVQLQSALTNLALNARDAMGDNGEIQISIENVVIDDTYMAQEIDIEPGEYVRLEVSDDGAGMSLEAQRRAFEPFFTTKAETGGTGLGLAMVYGFVRQSEGHVTLYSELGLGTSFGLYFPALSQPVPEVGLHSHSTSPEHALPQGKGEVVLVVEDNPKVRKLSLDRIRDLGYETIAAESGDQAYEILKSGAQVDLVFSDLVMPGKLNGYDLAARVSEEFPDLQIILTSGYASDVISATLAHAKHYEILHKPYRQMELANRFQAVLENQKQD